MDLAGRRIAHPLVLSPMVDVTDGAFRSIAKDWGADVTCSEMVSAVGLVRDNARSWWHVMPWKSESPYGVQFMCGEAEEMGEAVRKLATRVKPDFVDVNLGCPAPNIMNLCAGGYLMRDPKKAAAVVGAARKAADEAGIRHVSAKMRLGPDERHINYADVARECVAAGADWVTMHARTVAQGYMGQADWTHIGTLVEAVDVPVIGNGDLRTPEDVVRMRDTTHCAGFFIARAAMHDPTIFRRMRAALDDGEPGPEPTMAQRLDTLVDYLTRADELGITSVPELRRQALRFVAGGHGAKRLRVAFQDAPDLPTLLARVAAQRAPFDVPESSP